MPEADEQGVTGIRRSDIGDGNTVDSAPVDRLKRQCRAVGVKHPDVLDGHIPETTAGRCSELDRARARPDCAVADVDIVAEGIFIMGFQADTVIGAVHMAVCDPDVFTVADIHTVIIPVGVAVNSYMVNHQVLAILIGLHPARRVFQRYTGNFHVGTVEHFHKLRAVRFPQPPFSCTESRAGHLTGIVFLQQSEGDLLLPCRQACLHR